MLPPKRLATRARSNAITFDQVAGAAFPSTIRARSALYAISLSPVSGCSCEILASVSFDLPIVHCTPAGRISCPCVSESSHAAPAAPGPLQSDGARVQSQTQAATGLSGSSAPEYVAQPQDQIDEIRSSSATCRAASACHFTTSNQASFGCRPVPPDVPLV